MKAIKWFLISVLALMLVIAVYVGVFLDPNAFKPEIEAKVKEATGRTLSIDGDIGWSLFPKVGLDIAGISLGNIPGEDLPPLLSVKQAVVGVNLLPLIQKDVQIEEVTLAGVALNMVTLKDGRNSLEGLGGGASKAGDGQGAGSSGRAAAPVSWKLGQLHLQQLSFNSDNRQTQVNRKLAIESLSLEEFEPGRAAPFEMVVSLEDPQLALSTSASSMLTVAKDFSRIQLDAWKQQFNVRGSALPNGKPLVASVQFDADFDLGQQQFALTNLKLDQDGFELQGSGSVDLNQVRPVLKLQLTGNDLVLDPWMPAADSSQDGGSTASKSKPAQDGGNEEPDLSALRQFDLYANMSLSSIQAKQWLVTQSSLDLQLVDGLFTLNQMKASAFEGILTTKATLDSRTQPVSYQFDSKLVGLSIQPLLKAAIDSEVMAGTGELTVAGKGASLAPNQVLANLVANGRLALDDGAVYGINVAQKIREVKATFDGSEAPAAAEVQKTDFSSFATAFAIDKGVVTTPDVALSSPLLRVEGSGSSNLVTQQLDYDMEVAIVGSLEGQGGKSLDDLKGLAIPLQIGGGFDSPSVGIDMDALLQNKLDQEGDKLKEKLEDELKDKLFKGFGRG
ncbi:AsmA protein [Ferrimonas sediminum]|uniref:AsmA protein n=1 Tax=Ferrimonas sediminum TaxID=718193 RepID=A0A1G8X0H6_9GAMM|nr:AsmA family protein [Ferrimonas sediminum]SDJ83365.1 AsmA protein [Ferrimonas sediminum]